MKPGKVLINVPMTHNSMSSSGRREMFINDLVKHFDWKMGAEIGVRTGRTTFYLLDNNPELRMYAVDKDIGQFYNPVTSKKYQHNMIVLEGISWDVQSQVPDKSLDFVFVDAGHSYKSVMKDLIAWGPKLKDTGWFIGHDINFPAVNRAIVEKFGQFGVGPDNVWFVSPNKDYSMLRKL